MSWHTSVMFGSDGPYRGSRRQVHHACHWKLPSWYHDCHDVMSAGRSGRDSGFLHGPIAGHPRAFVVCNHDTVGDPRWLSDDFSHDFSVVLWHHNGLLAISKARSVMVLMTIHHLDVLNADPNVRRE